MRARKYLAIAIFPFSTTLAQTVTYDFTGTVGGPTLLGGTGIYASIPDGTPVVGTYTFDYGAAIASQSRGVVGSPAGWILESAVGSDRPVFGESAPSGQFIFTSTAHVGGFSFSTGPTNTIIMESLVSADFNPQFQVFTANENGLGSGSQMQLLYPMAYGSNGLPTAFVGPGIGNFGTFDSLGNFSYLGYTITSLTPAFPEPSVYAMTIAGLAALGFATWRRRATQRAAFRSTRQHRLRRRHLAILHGRYLLAQTIQGGSDELLAYQRP